jgi:transposase
VLPYKDALCKHLQERYGELFGTKFDFLLYDITSTYFEGTAKSNPQAQRGYSRDGRPDCVQVCIGLVASREGLPLAYEVFEGNRTDVTTVEDMVDYMEAKYGQARHVWVMDRGMVSEENLEYLRKRHDHYLVGTPKSMLKHFERELLDTDWEEVASGYMTQAIQWERRAVEFYRKTDSLTILTANLSSLATYYELMEDLESAEEAYKEAVACAVNGPSEGRDKDRALFNSKMDLIRFYKANNKSEEARQLAGELEVMVEQGRSGIYTKEDVKELADK